MITAVLAATLAQAAPAAPDYVDPAAWLCRPGRADACAANQDVTVVAADGNRRVERFKPTPAPKFDCFYVYPTVSNDPGPNSDLTAGPEENRVAAVQAGRFAASCRVFAPLYRQVTLTALRQNMLAGTPITGRAIAYTDVKAAWDAYLARDNQGRGVLLVGHSQGSGILKELLAREIEGRPVARRMIAAYLAGTNVVAGDLKTPPCESTRQTGCTVAWVSFRADTPPATSARFGATDGKPAQCVDAAALNREVRGPVPAGGVVADPGTFAHAILPATGAGESSTRQGPWTRDGAAVTTAFVAVPGLVSTRCEAANGRNYLAVTVHADPADARTDTIAGDVVVMGELQRDWGLHLIDMPVVMGDLVELSAKQAAAWRQRR